MTIIVVSMQEGCSSNPVVTEISDPSNLEYNTIPVNKSARKVSLAIPIKKRYHKLFLWRCVIFILFLRKLKTIIYKEYVYFSSILSPFFKLVFS